MKERQEDSPIMLEMLRTVYPKAKHFSAKQKLGILVALEARKSLAVADTYVANLRVLTQRIYPDLISIGRKTMKAIQEDIHDALSPICTASVNLNLGFAIVPMSEAAMAAVGTERSSSRELCSVFFTPGTRFEGIFAYKDPSYGHFAAAYRDSKKARIQGGDDVVEHYGEKLAQRGLLTEEDCLPAIGYGPDVTRAKRREVIAEESRRRLSSEVRCIEAEMLKYFTEHIATYDMYFDSSVPGLSATKWKVFNKFIKTGVLIPTGNKGSKKFYKLFVPEQLDISAA